MAGLPPGEHKVKIELVDANHNVFPGQVSDGDVHHAPKIGPEGRAQRSDLYYQADLSGTL